MFPATLQVLDDFNLPDGALGSNWNTTTPPLGYPALNVISGRRMACGNVAGSASAWNTLAAATAVFVQVSTLPLTTSVLELDIIGDLNALPGSVNAQLSWNGVANWQITLNTQGGSSNGANIPSFSNGDWFALAFDNATLTATGWAYVNGVGPWTQIVSVAATNAFQVGYPKNTNGWMVGVQFNDLIARVSMFGAETLAGPLTTTPLTAPVVHGRGAC